jgi:subtilase family serine protease
VPRTKIFQTGVLTQGEIVIQRLNLFLLAVIVLLSGLSAVCQAESQTLLTRHVREAAVNGQALSVGRLPASQSMRFDIVLALRHQPELENFLQELYDPSSSEYRHYVTVPEFTERFGPSQEDYNAVIAFAKSNGFTVVGGSRDAFDVQLKGTVASVEKAFHVTLGVYQHPTENRTFFAPDREPSVDLPFQLWHITGLDNYSIPRPALAHIAASQAQPLATTGSCPDKSFCGSDMRAAYYGSGSLTGSGQNIGLLEYAGFDIADVNTYYKNAGQTRTAAVTGISTDGSSVTCTEAQGCDDLEQTLDITQALGMAPGVTTLYVYVSDNSDTALLSSMSTHSPLPLSLSSSWTWDPADPSTDDPYFEKMAAQGQSFFQASGDGGSYTGNNALWPSNSAYVIAVGGTDLDTTGAGGAWKSETAWSAGGGGWGNNVDIPSWQVATAAGCSKCSQTDRNVPDVSANANYTFYVCADQTACTANEWGGTSFAAPMWAGYLALANQQAKTNGVPAPGFINPTIYPLNLSDSDVNFHDITSGSNGFPATQGYDLATGWGSPNGAGLINALAGKGGGGGSPTVSLSPTSLTWGKIAVGVKGAAKKVTLTNTGTGTLDLTSIAASGDFAIAAGSAKTACGSTVAAGGDCIITVTFTPTKTGTRTGTVTITDNASNNPQSVALSGTGK